MKTLTLYGLNRCSTCVKARQWLQAQQIPFVFIDYRDEPVAAGTLKTWADQLGGWEKLVNRASMTWRALNETERQASTDAQWQALIAQYPTLVRRPVAVDAAGEISVGFNEKRFTERFL